jgi:hypothetical protein
MPVKAKSGVSRAIAATTNIDIALEAGTALIVALIGSSFVGTVDFQNTIDGVNYANTPYRSQHSATPSRSVAQLSNPSTRTEYVVLPHLTQARIAIVRTSGTLTVEWREVEYEAEDAA